MTDDLGLTVPAEQGGYLSRDLLGLLVCLRPTSHDEPIETKLGPGFATRAEALIVNEYDPGDEPYTNAGEVLIFWTVVRKQLHSASPWIAGRIRKVEKGNAYRLFPPEGAEMEACRRTLLRHRDNPISYVGQQGELGESLPGEDAPF